MLSLESLFCHVDDFCRWFEPRWQHQLLSNGLQHRRRSRSLCLSEIMTILVAFHQSAYRNFKWFYTQRRLSLLTQSLSATGELQPLCLLDALVLLPLCAYLRHCFGKCTGISFIDSTSLNVCHNRRIAAPFSSPSCVLWEWEVLLPLPLHFYLQ